MKRTKEQVARNRAAVGEVIKTTGIGAELVEEQGQDMRADAVDKIGKPIDQVAHRRPRSLWVGEMRLREAFDALAERDPDCEMTPDDADRFLAQYVDREAAVEVRDELGDFVLGMEAFAQAKRAEASALLDQAEQIEAGCERMRASTVKTMDALGVGELRGHYRSLKVKRSPGSVEVIDETKIPKEYWRVKDDDDLKAGRSLFELVRDIVTGTAAAGHMTQELAGAILIRARGYLQGMERARTAIDKKAIQARWKEAGGDTVDVGQAESLGVPVPFIDGEVRSTTEALRAAKIDRLPVVPGVAKLITTKLEIK